MTAHAKPLANLRSVAGLPTPRLAIWWVISSEIVIFGGLLTAYILYRLAHDAYSADSAHTNQYIGGFNTLVLLTSSLSAVLAHKAAESGDGKKAAKLLLYTCLGGLIFLLVKSVEWTIEISAGYTLTASPFWSFYYTAAGIHASHVIAGVVIMLIVARDAWHGRELQRVEIIGLYWHFVDVVWIFLFPLLYIAK